MSWLDGMRHRLRSVLGARAYQAELDEEMRFHLELDAMQQGDADRARRRFGNRTWYAEEVRRTTWLRHVDAVRQDLGYAWRAVVRTPGLTIVVVATLALGIGANAAMFSLLDSLYLRPPGGVEDPASLRRIWIELAAPGGGSSAGLSLNYGRHRAIVEAAGDHATAAVFQTNDNLRLGTGRGAPRVRVVFASASYFPVLGVRPALGRFYSEEEDRLASGAPVAVVSHAFWRERLEADSAVLGSTLTIGKTEFTVIGVTAPSFSGLDLQAADVWIPIASMPPRAAGRPLWWQDESTWSLRTILRLEPGADESVIERRATDAVREYARGSAARGRDTLTRVHTGSIIEARGPGEPGQELVISTRLGGVAAIVLVVACANVVNLLLARAVRRRREIALRLALGISRARLVRLLTVETVLLACLAGLAALFVGWWGGSILRSLLLPEIEWAASALHWRVVTFTVAIALVSGLLAGFIPAVQASDPDLVDALKDGSHGAPGHRSRLRGALVAAQAALSVTLLVGAALFVRSLENVRALDIGYDSEQLLFGEVHFEDGASPPTSVLAAAMRDIAARLADRPGIEAVARAGMKPMYGFAFLDFFSDVDSSGSFAGLMTPTMSAVSPEFLRAAGIGILRGRGFSGGDSEGAAAEVVVNQAMARLLWPDREALGQCMRFVKRANPCYTVVGVAENVRLDRIIEEEPAPQYYLPLGNMPIDGWSGLTIVARSSAEASAAAAAELRTALRAAFPTAEATITPMSQQLEPQYRPWRLGASLFTALGLLALIVTLVGIYSTVAYGVSQRTHEFGVRIALGARIGDVLRQVVGEGLRTVAIGVALGIVLALAAGRLVAALLYGVSASDPAVMLLVALVLLAVAALAAVIPAWRAARVDPVTALRAE